jgi:flagellin
MASVINTNVMSLSAQKNLSRAQGTLGVSMQRLSTGLRINSAKDDAAGLAISESMTSQVRGMNVAMRNANDGISIAQTAESNLQEVTNALQRIRELAVQSSNGTYSTSDRAAYQKEVGQMQQEIGRILDTANFNGQALFSSNGPGYVSQINFQIGADNLAAHRITVSAVAIRSASALTGVISTLSVSSLSGAQSAIGAVDAALRYINETRATWGAVQSRFESVIANTQNVVEATEASRSRIRDADFAAETANLAKSQIMTQASMAMLSQANASPQSVLSLLG